MNFKNKYLKYKFKYLSLKKQIGGSEEIIDEEFDLMIKYAEQHANEDAKK